MFRQTPSGPTFTQTPLPCEPDPEDEPEPDWAGAVAGVVLAGAGAGAEVAGVLCLGVTGLGFAPPLRVVPPLVPPLEPPLPDPALVPPPPPPAARAGVRPDEPRPGWVSCLGANPPPRPPGSASAKASCAAGSRGQCPIRAVSRSLRSADRRCPAVMPSSR